MWTPLFAYPETEIFYQWNHVSIWKICQTLHKRKLSLLFVLNSTYGLSMGSSPGIVFVVQG